MVVFLPKENLYYFLEKKLYEKKIILSNETINEKAFSFSIKNSDIFYNDIKFSKVKEIDITLFLFFNKVKIDNIKILDDFKDFIPQNIDIIELEYSILDPLIIKIHSIGEFGKINGTVNLFERIINLDLSASNKMKNKYETILKQMKLVKGSYKYEYKF